MNKDSLVSLSVCHHNEAMTYISHLLLLPRLSILLQILLQYCFHYCTPTPSSSFGSTVILVLLLQSSCNPTPSSCLDSTAILLLQLQVHSLHCYEYIWYRYSDPGNTAATSTAGVLLPHSGVLLILLLRSWYFHCNPAADTTASPASSTAFFPPQPLLLPRAWSVVCVRSATNASVQRFQLALIGALMVVVVSKSTLEGYLKDNNSRKGAKSFCF